MKLIICVVTAETARYLLNPRGPEQLDGHTNVQRENL